MKAGSVIMQYTAPSRYLQGSYCMNKAIQKDDKTASIVCFVVVDIGSLLYS